VQQNDGLAVGGACLGITDIEQPGIDLLQRCERRVRARLESPGVQSLLGRFCLGGGAKRELDCGKCHGSSAEKAAAVVVDLVGHLFAPVGR